MIDSRLAQIVQLADDIDELLAAICSEGHTTDRTAQDFNNLHTARLYFTSAVAYVQAADSENRKGGSHGMH